MEKRRIDVFDANGDFITEIPDANSPGPMAVDSAGNLYVSNYFKETEENVVLYKPAVYKPEEGLIEYGNAPAVLVKDGQSDVMGISIEPATDRLWIKFGGKAELFASAAEGNALVENFEADFGGEGLGIAVDQANERLYGASLSIVDGVFVKAFDLLPPHEPLFTIKGSAVPNGKFDSGALSLAVDEGNGHLLVFDGVAKKVYEFDSSGNYLGTIDVNVGKAFEYVYKSSIAVDNGENSPNGAEEPLGRYLYVPSGLTHPHSFAFGPPHEGPPSVESVSFANVGETEAELRASIEPFGLPTHYVFEYVTLQSFEENGGFATARVAGEGIIPPGTAPISVSAGVTGLQPGTIYRFRTVATNTIGADEEESQFATYPAGIVSPPCPNEVLRTGLSALLPDCRAYELVTPPDTNARAPYGGGASNLGTFFASLEASPEGDGVSFEIEGGSIPGSEATGSLAGDPYLSRRAAGGWGTSYVGPTGLEAPVVLPGGHSPDQGYSFWTAEGNGAAAAGGKPANYVRYPDGHSALVGRGSLGTDSQARGRLIAEGGSHIVFVSASFEKFGVFHPAVHLEPDAPPEGTQAIYDRTADEGTHVVSLLPGGKTPKAGEDAFYEGVSLDGRGIAFKIGETLYLRYNDEETYEVGKNVVFAGIAEGGNRVFYLQGGDLWRYDVLTGTRTPFVETGDATPVNVSADGSVAYFVSPTVITKALNPNGAKAVKAAQNLYRSAEGDISFVGTVTERDVVGEFVNEPTGGLGVWTKMVGSGRLANDPSRTTPDGGVLLFESRAQLSGYDPEGHVEVYRYDFAGSELGCLSCNPTLAPPSGAAGLQSVGHELGGPEALSPFARVANLSPDGRRVLFQSTEALVPGDTDGLQDVYEWEAQGVGTCNRAGGCLFLISSGHSVRTDYLYAVSDSGNDVFVRTSDLLLSSDLEETASIYDARVDGGFAEECLSQQCEPLLPRSSSSSAPSLPNLATRGAGGSGNFGGRSCPKGKRKLRHHGKVRCVKKKHHKHHHRRAGKDKKGGRK